MIENWMIGAYGMITFFIGYVIGFLLAWFLRDIVKEIYKKDYFHKSRKREKKNAL